MVSLCLTLIPLALLIAAPLTWLLILASRRIGAFDSSGVPGQVKAPPRRIPNTGGIAIFLAIMLPVMLGIALLTVVPESAIPEPLRVHLPGIVARRPLALLVAGCTLLLHLMGLIDDRRPLGPFLKLGIMALPALAVPLITTLFPALGETRLLTFFDASVGGPWLSIALTAGWILLVTNAMNFMDNMDGLSAGTAAVAGGFFFCASLVSGQWFVAALLALLVGACLGFLLFNAPRPSGARIFMGDGGSLVLGFLLAFLTVRTTYIPGEAATLYPPYSTVDMSFPEGYPFSGKWYSLLMPVVVLAVPLYDLVSVVIIRLRQGRSPFVGDLQHLSHRLHGLGLTKQASVMVIWGLTAVTGVSGISLSQLQPWHAAMVGVQIVIIIAVMSTFELAARRRAGT